MTGLIACFGLAGFLLLISAGAVVVHCLVGYGGAVSENNFKNCAMMLLLLATASFACASLAASSQYGHELKLRELELKIRTTPQKY